VASPPAKDQRNLTSGLRLYGRSAGACLGLNAIVKRRVNCGCG